MSRDATRLLAIWERLDDGRRDTLLDMAEFLAGRAGRAVEASPPAPLQPLPAPPNETVVQAIKRLNRSYPMLPRHALASHVERLLAEHMVEGRPAADIIAELETCYRERGAAAARRS
jgi:hypothetical protein